MSNKNIGKNWNLEEENILINEVNNLMDINLISEKHERQVGGIKARIKKILDEPLKSDKLLNKTEIIKKYFVDNKEEYKNIVNNIYSNILNYWNLNDIKKENNIYDNQIIKILNNILVKESNLSIKNRIMLILNLNDYDNYEKIIIEKILEFNSIYEIHKKYKTMPVNNIKNLLKNYLKIDNPDLNKKEKIKYILKSYKETKDKYSNSDDSIEIKNNKSNIEHNKSNIEHNKNNIENNVDLKEILKILNNIEYQIKEMKADIFDINKRVKYIFDKKYNDSIENNSKLIIYNNKIKNKSIELNKFNSDNSLENELLELTKNSQK
jgi:hypothetical protein